MQIRFIHKEAPPTAKPHISNRGNKHILMQVANVGYLLTSKEALTLANELADSEEKLERMEKNQ